MGSGMGRGHNARSGHKRGGPVTRTGPAEMLRGWTSLQSRTAPPLCSGVGAMRMPAAAMLLHLLLTALGGESASETLGSAGGPARRARPVL